MLNILLEDVVQGHPVTEQRLKEVLGHTPLQVNTLECCCTGFPNHRTLNGFQNPVNCLSPGHRRGVCGRPHRLLHAGPLCRRALMITRESCSAFCQQQSYFTQHFQATVAVHCNAYVAENDQYVNF